MAHNFILKDGSNLTEKITCYESDPSWDFLMFSNTLKLTPRFTFYHKLGYSINDKIFIPTAYDGLYIKDPSSDSNSSDSYISYSTAEFKHKIGKTEYNLTRHPEIALHNTSHRSCKRIHRITQSTGNVSTTFTVSNSGTLLTSQSNTINLNDDILFVELIGRGGAGGKPNINTTVTTNSDGSKTFRAGGGGSSGAYALLAISLKKCAQLQFGHGSFSQSSVTYTGPYMKYTHQTSSKTFYIVAHDGQTPPQNTAVVVGASSPGYPTVLKANGSYDTHLSNNLDSFTQQAVNNLKSGSSQYLLLGCHQGQIGSDGAISKHTQNSWINDDYNYIQRTRSEPGVSGRIISHPWRIPDCTCYLGDPIYQYGGYNDPNNNLAGYLVGGYGGQSFAMDYGYGGDGTGYWQTSITHTPASFQTYSGRNQLPGDGAIFIYGDFK